MTYQEILRHIAEENNTTVEEVEAEIQIAIDAAFDNPTPEQKMEQERLFGRSHRPTPEEFILAVAAEAGKKKSKPSPWLS